MMHMCTHEPGELLLMVLRKMDLKMDLNEELRLPQAQRPTSAIDIEMHNTLQYA